MNVGDFIVGGTDFLISQQPQYDLEDRDRLGRKKIDVARFQRSLRTDFCSRLLYFEINKRPVALSPDKYLYYTSSQMTILQY